MVIRTGDVSTGLFDLFLLWRNLPTNDIFQELQARASRVLMETEKH